MITPIRPAIESTVVRCDADFTSVELENALASLPVTIDDVTASSREAKRGTAFLAYPGAARDGRDFIAEAITRGVSAVLFDPENFTNGMPDWKVPHLGVPDLKRHASQIAGSMLLSSGRSAVDDGRDRHQRQDLGIAVDRAGMELAGRKSAVIGTIGNGLVGNLQPTDNTTPDAVTLQKTLSGIFASRCSHLRDGSLQSWPRTRARCRYQVRRGGVYQSDP